MPKKIEFSAKKSDRLDVLTAEECGMTRSRAGGLIRDGYANVNNVIITKTGFAVRAGDAVSITMPDAVPAKAEAQDIDIDVIYQDAELAVVFKPSGMVAHPAAGNPDGTLVNALLSKLDSLSGIGGEMRPGLVHRIDKDTSGLLLIAKNDESHAILSRQIAEHSVERAYWAIVQGRMREERGIICAPIGRSPKDRKKMAIVDGGREALTSWRTDEELTGAALVECVLSTGRTHQIRVHMASINHPVLGDPAYGPKKPPFPVEGGQLLHAYKIGFTHPKTGQRLLFSAKPEPRFVKWYKKLGGHAHDDFT